MKTQNSHAFFVGTIKTPSSCSRKLVEAGWQKVVLTQEAYQTLCSQYYQSHVDAMVEAEGQKRPRFLQDVHHYEYIISEQNQEVLVSGSKMNPQTGEKELLLLDDYHLNICKLHIYQFPLKITLFAIEVNDSGSDLNELTQAHFWLSALHRDLSPNTKQALNAILKPLFVLMKGKDVSDLIKNGNKLKIFQIVQLPEDQASSIKDEDTLLYEIGSSTAIGIIHSNHMYAPSDSYYEQTVKNNSVSTFKQWKALALVDSFTVLTARNDFNDWPFINHYFPLIYLRCIFEDAFCFSRNNVYRLNKDNRNLAMEINQMEKYYFYGNISFNFQPPLLYEAMARGIGIAKERRELTSQIKEKEEKNSMLILATVSVFAAFSIAFDLYSILIAAKGVPAESVPRLAIGIFVIAVLFIVFLLSTFYSRKRI